MPLLLPAIRSGAGDQVVSFSELTSSVGNGRCPSNREYLNDFHLHAIDDPVVPLDDFSNAGSGKLRYRAPHLGELRQPVTALNDAVDELLGGSRIGPSDEILDLDETHERLF